MSQVYETGDKGRTHDASPLLIICSKHAHGMFVLVGLSLEQEGFAPSFQSLFEHEDPFWLRLLCVSNVGKVFVLCGKVGILCNALIVQLMRPKDA